MPKRRPAFLIHPRRRPVAESATLAGLVLIGFTFAAAVPRGSESVLLDVTMATEPTATTTTTPSRTGPRRVVVWSRPRLTVQLSAGWQFLFDDPRKPFLLPNAASKNWVEF